MELTETKEANIASELDRAQRAEIGALVSSRWRHATDNLWELIHDSNEAWNYYLKNRPDASNVESRTNLKAQREKQRQKAQGLRLGVIPKVVDSALAFQHNATFPLDDRFFRGVPQNEEGNDPGFQEAYELSLASRFAESNVAEAMRQFRLCQILDGTAAMQVKFVRKEHKKPVYEKGFSSQLFEFLGLEGLGIDTVVKKKTKNTITFEGTIAEVLDFNDWRVDPSARCMEDSWFCRRWYEPIHKIKAKYPWVDEDVLKPYSSFLDEGIAEEKRELFGLPALEASIDPAFEEIGEKHALVIACYDDFFIDGKEYKNHLAVVLNGYETIYFGPNEYDHGEIPYIVSPYNPIPNQVYGQSMVKHAIPSAEAIDKAVDSSLKIAHIGANPTFRWDAKDKALRQIIGKTGKLEWRPGRMYPTEGDSINQIPVAVPNLPFLFDIVQRAESNIQDVTGVNPFVSGDEPVQGRVSAFEIDARVQGGNSRYQASLTYFGNTVLEPFLMMAFENDKQFKKKTEMVNGIEISPDDIRLLDYKFTITSTQATLTRNRRLANLMAFIKEIAPLLIQNRLAQPKEEQIKIDLTTAIKRLLTESGMQDVDQLLEVVPGMPQQLPQEILSTNPGGNPSGLPSVPPTPNTAAEQVPEPGSIGAPGQPPL